MEPIAVPDVLDPNRDLSLGDGADDTKLDRAHDALRRACEYGQALWHELDMVRRYLYAEVADGGGDGSPSLLRSSDEWTQWARVFTGVSSRLAGPAGDSGAAESAARLKAQDHGVAVPPMGP